MEIRINGEVRTFTESLTIGAMLEALSINPGSVVVERNFRIVPRYEMASEAVQEGDTIEIIRLVGGG